MRSLWSNLCRALSVALCVQASLCQLPSYPKETVTIGGYVGGSADELILNWSPIFETYLTQEVGSLYSPPIQFKLIPVDYTSDTTSPKLISAGLLDVVCRF